MCYEAALGLLAIDVRKGTSSCRKTPSQRELGQSRTSAPGAGLGVYREYSPKTDPAHQRFLAETHPPELDIRKNMKVSNITG